MRYLIAVLFLFTASLYSSNNWWFYAGNLGLCSPANNFLGMNVSPKVMRIKHKCKNQSNKNGILFLDCRKSQFKTLFLYTNTGKRCLELSKDKVNRSRKRNWWVYLSKSKRCQRATSANQFAPNDLITKYQGCIIESYNNRYGSMVLNCTKTKIKVAWLYADSYLGCKRVGRKVSGFTK